jgi:hypothetical protein
VRLLRPTFTLVRENLGAYLVMNAVMYGLCLVGMTTALAFPALTAARGAALQEDGTADLVVSLLGNVWLFALTIFAVNTVTVALAMILLPSLVVPFAGIALAGYQAVQFGLSLAPVDDTVATMLIPHSLTMLIEFQAYVLVMFAGYLIGRAWLRPQAVGAGSRRQGYVLGLRQARRLGVPALALFVVGAVYEAFEIIYLIPPLLAA